MTTTMEGTCARVRKEGMEAVCALGHFAGLVAARPANRDELLAMDPLHFVSAMSRWRSQLLPKINEPVMGLSDGELRRIAVPTAIVPYYDLMHPHALSGRCSQDDFRQPLVRL